MVGLIRLVLKWQGPRGQIPQRSAKSRDCQASSRRLYVLFAQHLARMVEPDNFMLRTENRIPVLVNVLVRAAGWNRCQRAAWAFASGIAQQFAYKFVGISEVNLCRILPQRFIVLIGPNACRDQANSNRQKEYASSHSS